MKKILILLLIMIISIFTLTGCGGPDGKTASGKDIYYVMDGITFVRVIKPEYMNDFDVWVHKETKVMYIMFCSSEGEGGHTMSALLNADGSPMLWEGNL